MRPVLLASLLSLAAVAGCGSARQGAGPRRLADNQHDEYISGLARENEPSQRNLRGPAVGNFNKGYVDGVQAAAFFNKGRPLTDQQVNNLIEIGRRQGDKTGLLALDGYPDGYRAGAEHASNPYSKQMTAEQTAQVRKAQGLPAEEVVTKDTEVAKRDTDKRDTAPRRERKVRREAKATAEASARD